jgi:HEAT repeat protein
MTGDAQGGAGVSNLVVSSCVIALHAPELRVRIQAVSDLVALGAPAVLSLMTSLTDNNPDVRWRVIVALAWIGDPQAVEPLIAALSDNVWEVRQNAAWALGQIRDPRASEHLLKAIYDEDEQVCILAAYALVRIGDTQRLLSGLGEENEHPRRAASAGLSLLTNAAPRQRPMV